MHSFCITPPVLFIICILWRFVRWAGQSTYKCFIISRSDICPMALWRVLACFRLLISANLSSVVVADWWLLGLREVGQRHWAGPLFIIAYDWCVVVWISFRSTNVYRLVLPSHRRGYVVQINVPVYWYFSVILSLYNFLQVYCSALDNEYHVFKVEIFS